MDISEGYPSGVDVIAFMHEVRPQIGKKLTEEISALNGIKFQLALKVQLQNESPDGTEEFTETRAPPQTEGPSRGQRNQRGS